MEVVSGVLKTWGCPISVVAVVTGVVPTNEPKSMIGVGPTKERVPEFVPADP